MRSFSDLRLETPRLVLRPLAPTDAEGLWRIYADPDFMRYWSSEPWSSLSQAQALIEKDQPELARGEHLRLGIFLRVGGGLIGTCSLFHFVEASRRAEVGYGIAPAHWRQGYMSEAVGALLDFAFGELQLHRVEADIDPRNTASARSLERLGFTREGLLRERWIVGSEVSDTALYGLLAREWRAGGTPLQVRRARAEDAAELAQLAATAFWDTYREIDDPEDIASYVAEHFSADEMAAVLRAEGSTTLIAEAGGEMAGYAVLRWSEAPACVPAEGAIELARFYLSSRFIGHGHGRRLMQAVHAEARAQAARSMWLGVYDRNLRAVRFYERFGFTHAGGKEFLFAGKVYVDPVYAMAVTDEA